MLRTALRPKWLALLGVVALVVVAFVQLGRWQLGVARDTAAAEAVAAARSKPPVPLEQVFTPHTPFRADLNLRAVTVTGSYAEGQVLVPERLQRGVAGWWVITPFVDSASGARLAVLRGWVPSRDGIPEPPTGTLTVSGALSQSEGAPDNPPATGPGEIPSVDLALLVNDWSGEVYNAFLFLTQEEGAAGALPTVAPLERVPVPSGESGLNWRNAAYALQWWVFAGFALWMWWRMVREDRRRTTQPDTSE